MPWTHVTNLNRSSPMNVGIKDNQYPILKRLQYCNINLLKTFNYQTHLSLYFGVN